MRPTSIAAMMAYIGLVAVGCAALGSGSATGSSLLYSLALLLLAVAGAGAVLGRGRARAFCLGYALFGGGYIYLAYDSGPPEEGWYAVRYYRATAPDEPGSPPIPRPRLATQLLLDVLHDYVDRPRSPAVGAKVQVRWGSPGSYYPATVTKFEAGRVEILWQGYSPGMEEWVAVSRVQDAGIDHFHATGHALFALLLAWVGGLTVRRLFAG